MSSNNPKYPINESDCGPPPKYSEIDLQSEAFNAGYKATTNNSSGRGVPCLIDMRPPTGAPMAAIVVQPVCNSKSCPSRSENLEPRSYLSWSLANTLCCFCVGQWVLLCSLPALIFSCNVRTKLTAGQVREARNNSMSARFFNLVATLFILLFIVFCLAFMVPLYSRNMFYTYSHQLYQNQPINSSGGRSGGQF